MIVNQFHVVCIACFPAEADPVLVVHANAVPPGPISFQSLQAIAWRNPQVIQSSRPVQNPKPSQCDPGDCDPTAWRLPIEQLPRIAIAERPNHKNYYTACNTNYIIARGALRSTSPQTAAGGLRYHRRMIRRLLLPTFARHSAVEPPAAKATASLAARAKASPPERFASWLHHAIFELDKRMSADGHLAGNI
jgi:hypothetical protein